MTPDVIRLADFGHPGGIIQWLAERGYDAESFGTDGFGKPDRTGVVFSRDLEDGGHENHVALIGQALRWDGQQVVVEDA